jgi:hypothetical protein
MCKVSAFILFGFTSTSVQLPNTRTYSPTLSALSPTRPYPEHIHRLRLAGVLLPIALLTAFVKVQYMARGATFFMGVGFFSQPYITKGWRWFVKNYPNWMEFLEVQK